jgi:hypothetical protein
MTPPLRAQPSPGAFLGQLETVLFPDGEAIRQEGAQSMPVVKPAARRRPQREYRPARTEGLCIAKLTPRRNRLKAALERPPDCGMRSGALRQLSHCQNAQ